MRTAQASPQAITEPQLLTSSDRPLRGGDWVEALCMDKNLYQRSHAAGGDRLIAFPLTMVLFYSASASCSSRAAMRLSRAASLASISDISSCFSSAE